MAESLTGSEGFSKDFSYLKGYKPKKEKDSNFEPIKGTYDCMFNYARIEDYTGDKPEFQGAKFFRYELEICEGQPNEGRRLWASFNLQKEESVTKLADRLWTVTGLELDGSSPESFLASLEKVAEALVQHTVTVKAWYFKPKDAEPDAEPIQMHSVKGIATKKGSKKSSEVPF